MIGEGVGLLVAAAAACAAMLLGPGRPRAAAMLLALALVPALILADQWNSPQIADLRQEPAGLIALALLAAAIAVGALAYVFHRHPIALPLAIVFALPFRVPLEAAGDTANLLVPLYLVIAAGVIATSLRAWQGGGGDPLGELVSPPRNQPLRPQRRGFDEGVARAPQRGFAESITPVLAIVLALYAIQTLYSPDFSKSLQNVCFFFIPFALVFTLLRDLTWDRRLVRLVFVVVALQAVAFVVVGSIEFLTRSLFWNDQVIRSNEFHTYFRVNSIFWDPNIYGRYLALAIVLAMTALLWATERRTLALLTALIGVLWLGLVPTFSQSSFAALLGGLAVLAAVRWSLRWTAATVAVGSVLAVIVILFIGGNSTVNLSRINIDTGGRANLVSGGVELFAKRPVWGYGAGSFPRAYRERIATKKAPVSVSHTEPVTVAAEQGLIGLASYAALLMASLWTMARGIRGGGNPLGELVSPPRSRPLRPQRRGFDEGVAPTAPQREVPPRASSTMPTVARVAVLAAFVALLVHTMAYAGFYEDPIAWVLMAVGASLASAPVRDSP